jgi:hypothetical protein
MGAQRACDSGTAFAVCPFESKFGKVLFCRRRQQIDGRDIKLLTA